MLKISYIEQTHVGARHNNQDFYAHQIGDNWACFVLADGLGGHNYGEVASKAFCECVVYFAKEFANQLLIEPTSAIEALILKAHEKMRADVFQEYGVINSHTTFVLAWLTPDKIITAHIGDSRVYRIDDQSVIWRTPDHTLVQQLFEEGRIKEEDFENHPLQNRLLKTVNLFEVPRAEIYVHPPLKSNEILLLCSDGFWTHLSTSEFIDIAKTDDFKEIINDLFQKILKSHPKDADNITVQVVRFR